MIELWSAVYIAGGTTFVFITIGWYFLSKCFELPHEEICSNCKNTHHNKPSQYSLCSCGHNKEQHSEYGHCGEIVGEAITRGITFGIKCDCSHFNSVTGTCQSCFCELCSKETVPLIGTSSSVV